MDFSIGGVEIGAIIMGIWILASIIVRFTKTKKDDEIVSKVGKIFNLIFNKTNIKGAFEDKVKARIMDEALSIVTSDNADFAKKLENECENVTNKIFAEVKKEESEKGKGLINVVPKSVVGQIVFDKIDKKIAEIKPRTKAGKAMKRLFGNLVQE